MSNTAIEVPEDLKRIEKIIDGMCDLLIKNDLSSNIEIADFCSANRGISIDEIIREDEALYRSPGLLSRYYSRFQQSKLQKFSLFSACDEAEYIFQISTTDRLRFVNACELLAHHFDGENFQLKMENSWIWDQKNLQPDGSSTYQRVYVLVIHLQSKSVFLAKNWLQNAFQYICLMQDKRADACLFQWVKAETGKKLSSGGYHFNNDGATMSFGSKEDRDFFIEKAFGDCKTTKHKRDEYELYLVDIVFPR